MKNAISAEAIPRKGMDIEKSERFQRGKVLSAGVREVHGEF